MSLWSRIVNAFRGDRLSREIDEELQAHLDEAIEQGRDPAEARRSFGPALRTREQCRDFRLLGWLDSLRADTVFGWRQLMKRKVTSAAAILSLALAIGSCTSTFRLIDALLLRPLPVAGAERLYALSGRGTGSDGKRQTFEFWAYPTVRQMKALVKDQADVIAVSNVQLLDLSYGPALPYEQANVQHVSGDTFVSFGLRPALGRLIYESDDRTPGAHPYAVLSHDYWTRRFAQDPKVICRTFRLADDSMGNVLYEIVGVGPPRFTGTEPGTVADIFLPTMMYDPSVNAANLVWLRAFIKLKPDVSLAPVRERILSTFHSLHDDYNGDAVSLEPAAAGVSRMQDTYRLSLTVLGLLVALVLLIASANLANLMTAQASSRAREMALRVAIGAGRWRLAQLVLVESALLAVLAAVAGAIFAWWSAPFVVGMINPVGYPARLFLPADWRVLGFGAALTLSVTFLFGLAPALRASCIKPASALRGGEGALRQRRGMHALIAVQAAFCFLVLFVAGLFAATFERLTSHPTGFSAERLLTLHVVADRPQASSSLDQLVEHLRSVPGIEAVASAGFPLLIGSTWSARISSDGGPPSEDFAYRLAVSPGWMGVMRIPLLAGRNFREDDTYPEVAIINQTFARRYYAGANPIGKSFETVNYKGERIRSRIVGLAGDALYRDLHELVKATAYVPMHATGAKGGLTWASSATLLVRTAGANPLALASTLRREVARAQAQLRVKEIRTQTEINQAHAVRERLLATLALFFAIVALLLAGVGLYGVLDYTVLQRRRELGIRMALGAQAAQVARGVTFDVFAMLLAGAAAGLALGMISVRYISTLLYQVKATDAGMLAVPSLAIFAAAVLAAMPAVIRAVRIDPAATLRSE